MILICYWMGTLKIFFFSKFRNRLKKSASNSLIIFARSLYSCSVFIFLICKLKRWWWYFVNICMQTFITFLSDKTTQKEWNCTQFFKLNLTANINISLLQLRVDRLFCHKLIVTLKLVKLTLSELYITQV